MSVTSKKAVPLDGWLKISVCVPGNLAEEAAALLVQQSGHGVEISLRPGTELTELTGYLPAAVGPDACAAHLAAFRQDLAAFGVIGQKIEVESLADQDWNRMWKEFFRPFKVCGRLEISPSWEPPNGDAAFLVMDPGMAFGTGHHASTRLVLALMEELFFEIGAGTAPGSVLDIGTGTGILAMAAARFGACEVVGLDNDPLAVTAALENVRINRLDGVVRVSDRGLSEQTGPFDLVLANILLEPLCELAPEIARLSAAGARVICSGILAGSQEETLSARCLQVGLLPVAARREGEWAALLFERSFVRD